MILSYTIFSETVEININLVKLSNITKLKRIIFSIVVICKQISNKLIDFTVFRIFFFFFSDRNFLFELKSVGRRHICPIKRHE